MTDRYTVKTWSPTLQRFTHQKGLPRGPWGKWGLRRALRKLRGMGYEGSRHSDHYTMIEKV